MNSLCILYKNQKLILPLQASYRNSESSYTALKNELLKYPEVKSITSGSAYPGVVNLTDMLFFGEGKSAKDFALDSEATDLANKL